MISVKFKDNVHETEEKEFRKLLKQVTIKNKWCLNVGIFKQHEFQNIFKSIKSTKVEEMQICSNYDRQIILKIINPKYSQLVRIQLSSNDIDNIQAIQLLNCPNLKQMILTKNNIVKIQSFVKFKSKNLQILDLDDNHLRSLQSLNFLTRSSLGYVFKCLTLQTRMNPLQTYKLSKNHQFYDITYAIKLNPIVLVQLMIIDKHRIDQEPLYKCLTRKYKKLKG